MFHLTTADRTSLTPPQGHRAGEQGPPVEDPHARRPHLQPLRRQVIRVTGLDSSLRWVLLPILSSVATRKLCVKLEGDCFNIFSFLASLYSITEVNTIICTAKVTIF